MSRSIALLFTALLAVCGPARALDLPPAVQAYLDALAAVEGSTVPVSLEYLHTAAEGAQTALMEVTGDDAVLEGLSEADYAELGTRLRGFKISRGFDIYAQPQAPFFLELAKAHGRPEDIAYFEQEAATWGDDGVPVYLMLRRSPTPCVRFSENHIAPLYRGWQAYAKQYPDRYHEPAAQQVRDLEEAVALGTCACGSKQTVLDEQRSFLKAFPATPVAQQIKARMKEIRSDSEKLPVNCR